MKRHIPFRAAILIVGLHCLASLGIAADAPASPDAVAAPPSPAVMSPEDVFKDRGLVHMGFLLVLPGETQVHAGAAKLRASRGGQAWAHQNMGRQIKQCNDAISAMRQQSVALLAAFNQGESASDRIPRSNVDQYNAWARSQNALRDQLLALQPAIDAQKAKLDDLQKQDEALGNGQMAYVSLANEMSTKAESVAAAYAALATDGALKAAIDRFNQTAHPLARLGPSGLFVTDLAFVRQCAKEVANGGITLIRRPDDNEPYVQVTLNGKSLATMIWDSGATGVQISAETAESLGLHSTPSDPEYEITVADGRKSHARGATLDSIQIGPFTVRNVPCVLLPKGEKAPDLLGDEFQRHFVVQMDQQAGQLRLTPRDSAVEQHATADAPPSPRAAAAPPPPPSTPAQPTLTAQPRPPVSRTTVNLLALVNPTHDVVVGEWAMNTTATPPALVNHEGRLCRVQFQYRPPEEYDLQATFTYTTTGGGPAVILMCPLWRGSIMWYTGSDRSEFDSRGKRLAAGVGPFITPGVPHTSLVKVRKDKVRGFLDGRLVCELDRPPGQRPPNLSPQWLLYDTSVVGLGVWESEIQFSNVQVTEISGPGERVLQTP